MCSEQQAQRDRKREHPLPHRHPGNDVIDQVGGRLRHAAGTAGGTKATLLTGEGDELLMGAVSATQARDGRGLGCRIAGRHQTPLGQNRVSPPRSHTRLGPGRSRGVLGPAGTASPLRDAASRSVCAFPLAQGEPLYPLSLRGCSSLKAVSIDSSMRWPRLATARHLVAALARLPLLSPGRGNGRFSLGPVSRPASLLMIAQIR